MRNPVLYFFLLVLEVWFDLTLNIVHKCSRFPKILSKKFFKFISSEKNDPVTFDPGLILLPREIDPIPEKWGCKRDVFVTLGSKNFKIALALSTEILTFYLQVFKV